MPWTVAHSGGASGRLGRVPRAPFSVQVNDMWTVTVMVSRSGRYTRAARAAARANRARAAGARLNARLKQKNIAGTHLLSCLGH